MHLKIFFLSIFFSLNAWADRHEFFSGVAKENGKIVYTESHDVIFDSKDQVVSAKTVYRSPEGRTLGTLESDFRVSLSLPDHVFFDERTRGTYGIRRAQDKIILYNKDEGKAEQKIELTEQKDQNRVQIGCQGFSYFLKNRIDNLKQIKTLPVLFMIPGDLSTYKFVLELVSENPDQTLDFKVKIENWLLRAFAPQLEFKYDRKKDRIVWYKGISNIKSDSGKNMNVVIEYKWP